MTSRKHELFPGPAANRVESVRLKTVSVRKSSLNISDLRVLDLFLLLSRQASLKHLPLDLLPKQERSPDTTFAAHSHCAQCITFYFML